MKNIFKKSKNIILFLTILTFIFIPSFVNAYGGTQYFETKEHIIQNIITNQLTVYFGNVSVDGISRIKYIYSDGIVNDSARNSIYGILKDDYVELFPTGEGQIKVSNFHQEDMDDSWRDASNVANNYFTTESSTIADISNDKLYDVSELAVRVNIAKEKINFEKNAEANWRAEYNAIKEEWETANPNSEFTEEYIPKYIDSTDYDSIEGDFFFPTSSSSYAGYWSAMMNGELITINKMNNYRTIIKVVNTSVNVITNSNSTPIKYTATFESNGGSKVESQEIAVTDSNSSLKITEPSAPTKECYTFDGWYSDSSLNARFDFNNDISSDITLYAKWNELTSTHNER